jgi:hypothetical protein
MNLHARFDVFTAVKIHGEVFWIVTPCSVAVGYQEDGDNKILRNVGILPQHYKVSQLRRPQLEPSV